MSCPKLEAEKARAEQRERLTGKIATWTAEISQAEQRHAERRDRAQAAMDKASSELAKIQPARTANSDSKALTRYLGALGFDVSPDRLNDLLVLLAVLMIEAGGGLSLALGMALSGSAEQAGAVPADRAADHARTPVTTVPEAVAARLAEPTDTRTSAGQSVPDSPAEVVGTTRTVRPASAGAVRVPESELLTWLAAAGGTTEGIRRLAETLGRPRSTVSDECRRLATAGQLTLSRGRWGTVVALATGRPN